MGRIIGCDLGSTNSCFSVYEGGEAKVIPNGDGQRTTQSIVAFTKNGDELVGAAAARQMVTNAKNTVTIVKRLIGRKFSEVRDYVKDLPYEVVEAPNGDCRVKIGEKEYSPEEISARILGKVKRDASAYLGEDVTDIVVTVPAYFNDSQRQSVKDACRIAGLECRRILNEPTAAALAYSADKGINRKIAVYDLGGSTFDVSILDVSDGLVEVLATNGNTALGGHDIDVRLMKYVLDGFKADTGVDLSGDPMAVQRVKDECEKAKCALSTAKTYGINLPFIAAGESGPLHLTAEITQARLEEIADEVIQKTVEPCRKCIEDAGGAKIEEVLLVGGQTRMPAVKRLVKEIFGIEPSQKVNPDEAVGLGAAIQAAVVTGAKTDVLLLDVTPLTLSICTSGEIATPMIERNTTIPARRTQVFSNAAPMQSSAEILIGQGERKMFADNKLLGRFSVELTPTPVPGTNQIEITYDLNADGILTVSAFDKALNKKADITITSSSGLSKEEIEKAEAEARAHEAEDSRRLEIAVERNKAESLCAGMERAVRDAPEGRLTDDDRKTVADAVAKCREEIKADDAGRIKAAVEAATKAYGPVVAKLYADGSGGQAGASADAFKEAFGGDYKNAFGDMFGKSAGTDGMTDAKFES